jgi:peptidoglycan hydrolase-like protein with peptidoglycan-binding domain
MRKNQRFFSSKLFIFLTIFSLLISLLFPPFRIKARNTDEVLNEISKIRDKLESLRNLLNEREVCSNIVFNKSLRQGMRGPEVKCLQVILNTDPVTRIAQSGPGSPGNETDYFGPLTADAVKRFQLKNASEILVPLNLSKPSGVVGPLTVNKLNSLLTSISTPQTSETPSVSSGSENLSSPPSSSTSQTSPDTTPKISFNVEPSSINLGQEAKLTWQASNVSTCTGTNFSTNQATSGTVVVAPTQTTTYSISCEGSQGSVSQSVVVSVISLFGGGGGGGALTSSGKEIPSSAGTPEPLPEPLPESSPADLGCFLAGTKITMADGTYREIEKIQPGDVVKYYDFKEGKIKNTKVTRVFNYSPEQMKFGFYLVINNRLRLTPEQPLDRIDGSLISARDLKIGDKIQGENGPIEIFSIDKVEKRVPTYYLETESGHYFTDGFSDALKVFKIVDDFLASVIDILAKLSKILESTRR